MMSTSPTLLTLTTFQKGNQKSTMLMGGNSLGLSIENHLLLRARGLQCFLITPSMMALGKKEKCMGKATSPGVIVLLIEETTSMAENTDLADFSFLQASIMRASGSMAVRVGRALCSTGATKSSRKASGKKAYLYVKVNDPNDN